MRCYDFRQICALVVDDDSNMRTILRMVLESSRFGDIQLAASGTEAFERLQDIQPDIVITDWQMRGGDGIDFIRGVRNSSASPDRYLPIMMVSGFAHTERVREAQEAGASDFLVKPISPKTFVPRVISLIENPRPFVSTSIYFGPCRRRRDANYSGPERRIRRPQKALPGNEPSSTEYSLDLVDECDARVFEAPNRLGEKVGRADGLSPEILIARIEAGLVQLKQEYPSWAKADLGELHRVLDAARSQLEARSIQFERMHEISHNMRGQGGTFGYPLITEIGSSLCNFIEAAKGYGEKELEAIQVHVDAMQMVLGTRMEGSQAHGANQLLAGMRAVNAKLTSCRT